MDTVHEQRAKQMQDICCSHDVFALLTASIFQANGGSHTLTQMSVADIGRYLPSLC